MDFLAAETAIDSSSHQAFVTNAHQCSQQHCYSVKFAVFSADLPLTYRDINIIPTVIPGTPSKLKIYLFLLEKLIKWKIWQ